MTDSEFEAWASSPGRYVILVEVGTVIPKYLSTAAYTTIPTDTPPNLAYLPRLSGGVAFSEKLALQGSFSMSIGDITLDNSDGMLDAWLDEVWVNKAINVYVGDITWLRADFKLILSGIVSDLDSSARDSLNIIIKDKLQRLNTPVSEAQLGGTTSNADRLLPITLGEVHNVTPLLTDSPNHEYQFNIGQSERLIEVRDNGVPVTVTPDLAHGKFRHTRSPAGTITCSVQGVTPYSPTVAGIIKTLATAYGNPAERFSSVDLDLANFTAFDAANTAPVGVYLDSRANVLAVCQELAGSLDAALAMSREGKLRLLKVGQSLAGTPKEVLPHMYEQGSLNIADRTKVIAGVKLGYCKNYTVQSNLDTGIPAEHKDLFAQEWLTVTSRDSTVAAEYGLYAEPDKVDTLLLDTAQAQQEADRRLALWKVQRNVISLKGYAELMLLELGQSVKIYGRRFGLEAGRVGQVIGLSTDWVSRRVVVEVLI